MMSEEEAKKKWCPFSRPVFPRTEDCGYQTGNRNSVARGESQITEQSACIASACMAWRFVEEVERAEGSTFTVRKHGYCGLAGAVAP